MSTLLSPTISTASSSLLNDDVDMSLLNDKSVQGFEDLFNFDEFDSGAETTSHTHSPNTASPNNTPSPLPATQEPFTFNPSTADPFGFLENDFPIDYILNTDAKPAPSMTMNVQPFEDIIQVKQEPIDFGFAQVSTSQSPASVDATVRPIPVPQPLVASQQQVDMNTDLNAFAGLPIDQQAALQQLMSNILNYQKQFGLDLPNTAAQSNPLPSTVEPSMLFNNSSSGQAASSVPTISPMDLSVKTSASAPSASPAVQPLTTIHEDDMDVEQLRSVEAHDIASPGPNRSDRHGSTFSSLADDLDHKLDRLVPLPTIFSAGKGKGGKKGGGMSSVVRGEDEDLDDDDSWRPSPEEYKKLSSKEKRQLRNKLSARAFRTRRKDYIGTLESHIQDRDSVIDEMRAELINSRTENQDLRRELDALKASTMSILHPETATKSTVSPAILNALALSSALSAASPSTNAVAGPGPNTIRRSQTPLNTYNPRKDVSSASTKGFWGNDNMFGGGSTICHTMFTPDLVLPAANASVPSPIRSFADLPRVNLNPLLNDHVPSPTPAPAPALANPSHTLANVGNGRDVSTPFAEWAESTPFSLRSMDSYRMQMWSRLAREAAADKANLTGDMRPKFYVEASAAALGSTEPTAAALATAAIASNHISNKLASSFWSAFQGSGKTLDTDKLAAVVTGTARLHVVSIDKEKAALEEAQAQEAQDSLASLMGGLKLQTGPGLRASASTSARENPIGALCGFFRNTSCCPSKA